VKGKTKPAKKSSLAERAAAGHLLASGANRSTERERFVWIVVLIAVMIFILTIVFAYSVTARAQKLVDPSTVAPEYREAAEKRRDEQLRQLSCAKQAQEEKVLRRDLTTYIAQCLAKNALGK
jgi:hypothetical protein